MRFAFCCLLLLSLSHSCGVAARTGFLNRIVTVSGVAYRYVVFVPANWSKRQRWPMILFLHGAGERGDDAEAQTRLGLPAALRQHPERWPFVVVMPQARLNTTWSVPAMQAQALTALADAAKEFN